MHTRFLKGSVLVGILALFGACAGNEGGTAPTDIEDQVADTVALGAVIERPTIDACDHGAPGAHCHAKMRLQPAGTSATNPGPWGGYGPADLASAYNVPSSATSGGLTVAIVDAYDDPTAESDLAAYRQYYGIAPCTTANGCFRKVNEFGQASPLPAANSGWSGEISLDLDMVSAMCPDCKILLVEADSASITDLGSAVNTAANAGAAAISNSYGGGEYSVETVVASAYFNHPGVLVTASTGDSGYGPEFPAASPSVLAVGGTTLARSSSTRGWAEGAWSGGGAGCSAYYPKPAWQTDTLCANRTEADVSAVADPNTGVAVVQSGQWTVYGGTSAASPIIAALFTRLGIAKSASLPASVPYPYAHATSFYDITSGSDGSCANSNPLLCNAGVGYDGPTGLGTPNAALLVAASPGDAGADAKAPSDAGAEARAADAGADTNAPADAGTDAIATDASHESGVDAGPPPSFQLTSAQASVSVVAGSSVTDKVLVTVTGGFQSAIALSVSGLPAGATAVFSPTSLSGAGSAELTLATAATVTPKTYALTIVASGSGLTSNAPLSLSVTQPFTMSTSPSTLTLTPGQGSATTTITLQGITSNGTLSISTLPAGVTATSSGGACSASGVCSIPLTLQASSTAVAGTYAITLSATETVAQRSVPLTIVVAAPPPSFAITLGSSALTLVAGASGTLTATVAGNATWNSTVALGVTGMPTGVTVQPVSLPAPGSGKATLTVTVGANTSPGTYPLTVNASGSGVTHSAPVVLTVQPAPTFTLALGASSVKVAPGATGSVTAVATATSTFTSAIAVTASGMPSGVTVSSATIAPPGAKSASLAIAVGAKVATGNYVITVKATGGGVTQTAQFTLGVSSH